MRRTVLLALVATLLFVPTALAAGPTEILRDCQDDDVLQGNYTLAELRKARSALPTDVDEYSACRDVLDRAIAKKTASPTPTPGTSGGGGDPTGGAGGGGGGGTDPGAGTGGGGGGEPSPVVGADSGRETPATPQENEALTEAWAESDREEQIEGRPVSPGASLLAADVGRNGLPGTMIAVLALLAAAAVALAAPTVRRLVLARRQA
jgi:hypothetical protein